MAANVVRQALDEATELAQNIYPPLLEGRGLASAIRSAAEQAGVTVGSTFPRRRQLSARGHAAVYWTCVDALSAASRGSQAR